ncbi:hypothetical protein [Euzebya rosea]|uniref:hypothetical protein n=1 Tax=Euzebya rosea TaxID=2052804 RepID=UPI000DF3D384|nr:hypothetical protein [Euzebya rosea]
MIVVIPVVVVLGGLLLWALYAEEVPVETGPVLRPWDGIPTTADITRTDFPLAAVGYDRTAVEQHLARVAAAWDALQGAHAHITPDPDDPAAGPVLAESPDPPPPPMSAAPGSEEDTRAEDTRAEDTRAEDAPAGGAPADQAPPRPPAH